MLRLLLVDDLLLAILQDHHPLELLLLHHRAALQNLLVLHWHAQLLLLNRHTAELLLLGLLLLSRHTAELLLLLLGLLLLNRHTAELLLLLLLGLLLLDKLLSWLRLLDDLYGYAVLHNHHSLHRQLLLDHHSTIHHHNTSTLARPHMNHLSPSPSASVSSHLLLLGFLFRLRNQHVGILPYAGAGVLGLPGCCLHGLLQALLCNLSCGLYSRNHLRLKGLLLLALQQGVGARGRWGQCRLRTLGF